MCNNLSYFKKGQNLHCLTLYPQNGLQCNTKKLPAVSHISYAGRNTSRTFRMTAQNPSPNRAMLKLNCPSILLQYPTLTRPWLSTLRRN